MKKRVLSSLKTSSSLVGKMIPGSTFISDMAAVTGKGMSSYTGNAHDLENTHVPGRVFFMKNRYLSVIIHHFFICYSKCFSHAYYLMSW